MEVRNKILNGDALSVLRTLPDGIVNTCVTSPPYWSLRDYGTGKWEGGNDPSCKHLVRNDSTVALSCKSSSLDGGKATVGHCKEGFRGYCPRCGACRVDQQLGLERTPQEYVVRLVEIFREVGRVLRPDGTLWLNLGDSFARDAKKGQHKPGDSGKQAYIYDAGGGRASSTMDMKDCGLKPKDLVGIPWRVAFALQNDDWYLRSDIIWLKINVLPESVTDRPTKSHEYIFLLARNQRYYYDAEAIMEKKTCWRKRGSGKSKFNPDRNDNGDMAHYASRDLERGVRNKRSVWAVPTQPYKGAHFATFAEDLIKPCILAGAPAGGLVLDPFMGAGTTGVVSKKLGRDFLGIELNPQYIEMAMARINDVIPPLLP